MTTANLHRELPRLCMHSFLSIKAIVITCLIMSAMLIGWNPSHVSADPIVLRVSVKIILDANGQRPASGDYFQDGQIQAAIDGANDALAQIGANWRLRLIEILDVSGVPQWFGPTGNPVPCAQKGVMEVAALSDPGLYKWCTSSINIYVLNEMDCQGICSFPAGGVEIIWIQNLGIANGSIGWLHEIGHYLNLRHTHASFEGPAGDCPGGSEGDCVVDTRADSDPGLCPMVLNPCHDNAFLDLADQANYSSEETTNILFNVMSYHAGGGATITPLTARLTPGQLSRTALGISSRPHVIESGDPLVYFGISSSPFQYRATHNSYFLNEPPNVLIDQYNVWELEIDFGYFLPSNDFLVGHDGPHPEFGLVTLRQWLERTAVVANTLRHPIFLKLEPKIEDSCGDFTCIFCCWNWADYHLWPGMNCGQSSCDPFARDSQNVAIGWAAKVEDIIFESLAGEVFTRSELVTWRQQNPGQNWPPLTYVLEHGPFVVSMLGGFESDLLLDGSFNGLDGGFPPPGDDQAAFCKRLAKGVVRVVLDSEYSAHWSNIGVHPPVPMQVSQTPSTYKWGTLSQPFNQIGHAFNASVTPRALYSSCGLYIAPDQQNAEGRPALAELLLEPGHYSERITCRTPMSISRSAGQVTIGGPSGTSYTIWIQTSGVSEAGSDTGLDIMLSGSAGTVNFLDLDDPSNNFETGTIDVYWTAADEIGVLQSITLHARGDDDIRIDCVYVDVASTGRYFVNVDAWVGEDNTNPLTKSVTYHWGADALPDGVFVRNLSSLTLGTGVNLAAQLLNTGVLDLNGGAAILLPGGGAAGPLNRGLITGFGTVGGVVSNEGVATIRPVGQLAFTGPISNAGLIEVPSGSSVWLQGPALSSSGVVRGGGAIAGSVVNEGAGLVEAAGQLSIESLTNLGVINIPAASSLRVQNGSSDADRISNSGLFVVYGGQFTVQYTGLPSGVGNIQVLSGTLRLNAIGPQFVTLLGSLDLQGVLFSDALVTMSGECIANGTIDANIDFANPAQAAVTNGATCRLMRNATVGTIGDIDFAAGTIQIVGALRTAATSFNNDNILNFQGGLIEIAAGAGTLINGLGKAISGFGMVNATISGTGGNLEANGGSLYIPHGIDWVSSVGQVVVQNGATLNVAGYWTCTDSISLVGGILAGGSVTNLGPLIATGTNSITCDVILSYPTNTVNGSLVLSGNSVQPGTNIVGSGAALEVSSGASHFAHGTIQPYVTIDSGGRMLLTHSESLLLPTGTTNCGEIRLSNSTLAGAPIIVGNTGQIRGYGQIQCSVQYGGASCPQGLLPGGLIVADEPGFTLDLVAPVDGVAELRADGGTLRIGAGPINGRPRLVIVNGGAVEQVERESLIELGRVENDGALHVALSGLELSDYSGTGVVHVANGATVRALGNVQTSCAVPNCWTWIPGSVLKMSGGQGATIQEVNRQTWAILEAAGRDEGPIAPSPQSFAFASVVLTSGAHVSLVDLVDNANQTNGPEAVYATSLQLGVDAVLNLNGRHVYVAGTGPLVPGPYGAGEIIDVPLELGVHGDINNDGQIDLSDLSPFIGVLVGLDTNPLHISRSDLNGDDIADGRDIQRFVNAVQP